MFYQRKLRRLLIHLLNHSNIINMLVHVLTIVQALTILLSKVMYDSIPTYVL